MFTMLQAVEPDRLDQAIDSFTDDDWNQIEQGYLDVAVQELGDWWKPALGLADTVDVGSLFCKLYQRSLTRISGV